MIRTIDGRRYLMRDQRPVRYLRALYTAYCIKFKSTLSMHDWLVQRGKVYKEVKR